MAKDRRRVRVPRTRNAGQWTEAQYWGAVRSGLRKAFKYWGPARIAKENARRKYVGKNKRQKWEYQCAECGLWFKDKEVQIDHTIPVGSLRTGHDLKGFLERLTCESGFAVLCKPCHQIKTNKERGLPLAPKHRKKVKK